MHRTFGAAALVLILVAAAADASLQKIALQGDAAPATEAGTTFAFTNGYIPVLPQISADGHVSFAAFLTGPGVNTSNDVGIWTGTPGALSLVVRGGQPAPGLGQGVEFTSFSVDFALSSPGVGSSSIGITATMAGPGITTANDLGIWKYSGGQLSLVAQEGGAAPGTSAGVSFTEPMFVNVSSFGDLSVTANLGGPGVASATNEAFWTDRDGSLELFLREGDQAPDVPGSLVYGGAGQFIGTGYTFPSHSFNRSSQFALQGNLTGSGVDTFSNEALFAEQGGQLRLLAREGDPAPGAGQGVTFGGNGVVAQFSPVSHNGLGQSAFTSRLGGSVSTQDAMFSNHTGTLQTIVRPLDPAPGTNDQFGVFGYPLLGESGRIAFRSALASGGFYPPFGIWWDQPGNPGELSALVIPGQVLPEDPAVTIVGTNFLWAFNAAGQLAFQASLDDAVHGPREALLVTDAGGALTVIVETGRSFDVHGDGSDLRTISSFGFGGMSDDGTIAFRLDFTDGTFGFFTGGTSVPTAVVEAPASASGMHLGRAAPNPFRSATTLTFEIPRPMHVTVDVLDVAGRQVSRLLDGRRDAGAHSVVWDGTDRSGRVAASGVYFVRAVSSVGSESRKVVRTE